MRHDPIDVGLGPREKGLASPGPAAMPRVVDRMTRPAVTVGPDTLAATAWATMRNRKIRHLPVVDARDRLIGIVTDRDLRRIVVDSEDLEELARTLRRVTVGGAMTARVVTVRPETEIHQAAHLMRAHRIGALPVVVGDSVIGVLTRTDVVAALLDVLEPAFAVEAAPRTAPGGRR